MDNLYEMIERAEKGDVDAICAVAKHYIWNVDDEVEEHIIDNIWRLLEDAIDKNCAEAMIIVGDMFSEGRGARIDKQQAEFWYNKAVEVAGDVAVRAMRKVSHENDAELEATFKNYARMAVYNNPLGYLKCGDMYMAGEYVKQSEEDALNCYVSGYELAIKEKQMTHYAELCMKIGQCYFDGAGLSEPDAIAARQMFEQADNYYKDKIAEGIDMFSERDKSQRMLEECDKIIFGGCRNF